MGCVPFTPDYSCCDDWADLTPELQERATDLAWSTIRTLSGSQIGNCPTTVRPCLSEACSACSPWAHQWMTPSIRAGEWVNSACGSHRCSCERMCEIVVPSSVAVIAQVLLDGTELPLEDFRVDNGNRIVRQDGGCWPSCQNMTAPLGSPGTLGITYVPGIVPSAAGLWAVGVLACEFSKACTGGKCRLPSSVTSIARQGVTMTFGTEMFPGGRTGIREIDAYLFSINPHGLKMPPMVWSPDVPWGKHRYETPIATVTP